ncbi:MAG: right-handed parallel beta-helix repeat-containing protein [Armatimonadota bacterium]
MHHRFSPVLAVIALLIGSISAQSADLKTTPGYWKVSDSKGLIAAASKIGPYGGTIVLKPGIYVIDKTITFTKVNHITIEGAGWNTGIQKRGEGDVLAFVDCGFTFIRNLLIGGDGSAKTGSGIVFKGYSSSNTIDTCRISGNALSGVRFEGDAKFPQSCNMVKYCHFIDNRGDQLWSQHNNDYYIIGNQFGAHQRVNDLAPTAGAIMDHSSAGTYTMNYHWENKIAMRLGPGSHFNRIENNRFEMSRECGVVIGSPDDGEGSYLNIFTGNTIHTNSMGKTGAFAAVQAYNSVQTTFTSNQVFSWNSADYMHKSGLVMGKGCDKWIVKDNFFYHNTEKPLVYDEKASHIIKDNVMD